MRRTSKGIREDSVGYENAYAKCDQKSIPQLWELVEEMKRRIKADAEPSNEVLQLDETGKPIKNRFELFRIAFDINTTFQQRAATWAKAGNGRHTFAPVKGVHRVYQKVKRAYGGRIHRVCDIVRTTLIFNDVEGIIKTLEAVQSDADVTILRVKNRYAPDYKSEDCYRDVALLVKGFGGPLTKGFVCELQLNLQHMYLAKSEGGHKRYKEMRDARGD
jgi:hypothetical protein